ncbi:MAG: hypothetical protein Q9209_000688 [Squamulea sp. 1 TL-2023]
MSDMIFDFMKRSPVTSMIQAVNGIIKDQSHLIDHTIIEYLRSLEAFAKPAESFKIHGKAVRLLCAAELDCDVPETTTKLKLETAFDTVPAYAMQQVLKHAGQAVQQQLSTVGDRILSPSEIPWYFQSNGLYIRADMSGWSWRMLKNTLDGLEHCLFRKGIFQEVYVNAVIDPTALDPDGERHLSLLNFPASPLNGINIDPHIPHRCVNPETHTRLLYFLGGTVGAYNMQELLDGAQHYVETKIHEGGDRRLSWGETPLVLRSHGLVITAQYEGWSWQVLNHTIASMRLCFFKKGVFRAVDVVDIVDPSAVSGQRFLRLRKDETER